MPKRLMEEAIASTRILRKHFKLGLLLKEEAIPKPKSTQKRFLNSEYAEAECELAMALVAQKDFETARNHFLNA